MSGVFEQQGAVRPQRDQLRSTPRRPGGARRIARLASQAKCARCDDTGSVWVVCPDAGAVKLPCDCAAPQRPIGGVQWLDAGLATAFLACCGVAYFVI